MRKPRLAPLLVLIPLLLIASAIHGAAQNVFVRLETRKPVAFADGKDIVQIIARVQNGNGAAFTQAANIRFQSQGGVLSATQVQAFGGFATVNLRSQNVGMVRVTANVDGGIPGFLDVEFTDDPTAVFQGNNYLEAEGSRYLAFSVTDKIISAEGKKSDASLKFRNLEVTGDSLQLDCKTMVVRGNGNITLKRGKKEIKASRLFYNMAGGEGYALTELDGKLQIATVKGEGLELAPLETPIPNTYLLLPEPQVKLVVVAQGITLFPGERLLFRRPKFFQDQAQILSLPYYSMGLYTDELFSDQFLSVGTNGLGLEMPFYYNLTPRSTGILFLRHQQQLGRGFFATAPGWSLDMVQGYKKQGEQPYEGAFEFSGLTRGDWGFRFSHSQQFTPASQGSFYLDFPQHRGVFTALNYTQQTKVARWGGYLTGGQTFLSGSDQTVRGDLFVETQPHMLARSKAFNYTIGANMTNAVSRNSYNGTSNNLSERTQSLTMRAYSNPLRLDTRTTLGTAFTVGHTWSNWGTGPSALATVNLDHTFSGGSSVAMTYDFINQPLGAFYSGGKHRMALTYTVNSGRRFQAWFSGSAFLDSADASFFGDLAYTVNRHWRLMTGLTFQTFQGENFRDIQFTIGRRIGAREVQLTYSTLFKRISLDLTATRF